ncbi:hypothetical protein [Actinocorallia populi]|uniref:hypothetical protein n=1 Tax=Actinocorallia populi TaxID=2079200 RepID=UPI0013009FD0|nr:hypothetical protein [Actinocorallia populi]
MGYLSESDQQAVMLASELQRSMQEWLHSRGVHNTCSVSPYVDSGGQPAVLIKMNSHVAHAMLASFRQGG